MDNSTPPYPCWDRLGLDTTTLSVIGRALLERVEQVYADTQTPLPARRFWSTGAIPPDCEQLVVALTGLSEGLVNSEGNIPDPCANVVNAKFTVSVSRCVPVPDDRGTPPSPEQIGASADLVSRDAYLLAKAACAFDMFAADHPDKNLHGGMGVEWEVTVNNPEGGVQTTELELTTVLG